MLMCLGPCVFTLRSGLQSVDEESSASFAKHEPIGAGPVYEAMGQDEHSITISGMLHPTLFGFQGTIATLETIKESQTPVPLMRADFRPVGWYIVQSVSRTDTELNDFGIGKEIEFSVSLLKVGSPGIGSAASILSLFS